MNISTFLRPVAAASLTVMSVASVKAELLKPVKVPGQAEQRSPDVYATSMFAHHLGLLCQQTMRFAELSDGWDGYGGAAPSIDAISNTIDLLNNLSAKWTFRLPVDGLTPTPYGTITLEWTEGDDFLSLEIGDEQWSFIAELEDRPQLASAEIYPNPEMLVRVSALLYELFPTATVANGSAYTA